MSERETMVGPWAQGGREIAALRQAREITMSELAEQAGLPSAAWVADVEAGRRSVPSVFYRPMAAELGMDVKDFAGLCLSFYDPKAYEALFGGDAPALRAVA